MAHVLGLVDVRRDVDRLGDVGGTVPGDDALLGDLGCGRGERGSGRVVLEAAIAGVHEFLVQRSLRPGLASSGVGDREVHIGLLKSRLDDWAELLSCY